MDNNFHNQLEQQITREVIKGSLYNQKMGELHNTQMSYTANFSRTGNAYYEPLRTKKYKSQIILYALLNIIGIGLIILITLLFM